MPPVHMLQLPDDWIGWLDHVSLLNVKVAGIRIEAELEDQAWRGFCAAELGIAPSQLCLSGPTPAVPSAGPEGAVVASGGAPRRTLPPWRRVFYDLDVAGVEGHLLHTDASLEFFPSRRGEAASVPRGLIFVPDEQDRVHSCYLSSFLGFDRCAVASSPLPSFCSATALPRLPDPSEYVGPEHWIWQTAYRPAGYYEVTLGCSPVPQEPGRGPLGASPCISVGLCTPGFTRVAINSKQAGWDAESWALHGDDGCTFHGASHGERFEWEAPAALRRVASEELRSTWREGQLRASFGHGDIVGCGIVHLLPEQQVLPSTSSGATSIDQAVRVLARGNSFRGAQRGIFFTKNGKFLGMPFVVDDGAVPMDVPLFPCVGIDAHWLVSLNLGQRPFCFDLDAALPPLELRLASRFDTFETWPRLREPPIPPPMTPPTPPPDPPPDAAERPVAAAAPVPQFQGRLLAMLPLTSKFTPRRCLGQWASVPAQRNARRYGWPRQPGDGLGAAGSVQIRGGELRILSEEDELLTSSSSGRGDLGDESGASDSDSRSRGRARRRDHDSISSAISAHDGSSSSSSSASTDDGSRGGGGGGIAVAHRAVRRAVGEELRVVDVEDGGPASQRSVQVVVADTDDAVVVVTDSEEQASSRGTQRPGDCSSRDQGVDPTEEGRSFEPPPRAAPAPPHATR